MKILFVNQFYWPDMAATSQMMADLCQRLANKDHEIHVLCSRGQYDDGSNHAKLSPRSETRDHVHIHRVKATGFGKKNMLGRIADYLSFHLLVGLRILFTAHRYDVIVTLTTPPLIGLYATPMRIFTHVRHVCWVMDLHPDCEFELGVFNRKSLLPRLLDYLNSLHFRKADRCVVLGACMAKRLQDKQVLPNRIRKIPVWGHELEPADPAPLRQELGLTSQQTILMYSGNAGLIHHFDAVCQAALRLRDDDRFVFLFVGGGKRIAEIQAFKKQHQLNNLQVRGYFPREQLAQSLRLADAHLITLRDGMAGVAVPCKLYGIMAAAKPAIFIGPSQCETAQTIEQYQAGCTLTTDDADGLVTALKQLADDPERWQQYGRNAKTGYLEQFNADQCAKQWSAVLEELAGH